MGRGTIGLGHAKMAPNTDSGIRLQGTFSVVTGNDNEFWSGFPFLMPS